ncbi:MAG: N-acetylglucosamine-6-phosphate deacetylase [Desulfurococcaceae archaeon]
MKQALLLRNARIYTPYEYIYPGYIIIDKGVIKEIGREPYPHKLEDVEELDLNGMICGPGFIDTHIHGILGYDTMDGSKKSFIEMSKSLVRYGVTSFIPSTVSAPHEKLVKVSRVLYESISEWNPKVGARILGLHVEGPYINPVKAGAHNRQYIREPSIEEFNQYYEASGGFIKELTLAPELKNSLELIKHAVSKGVIVQVGHTNATYDETINAIISGASKATHIYNGMREIHHREPGVVVALLRSPSIYVEIIVDFIHVSPQMVEFTIDYVGVNRIVAVSDAISATGLPDGIYSLGELKIEVKRGISRLVETGSLAGSTLTMDRAFRNLVSLGYSIDEVFKMTSTNPARSINADILEKIGLLKPNYKADIVVLDQNLEVAMTIVEGNVVYQKQNTRYL